MTSRKQYWSSIHKLTDPNCTHRDCVSIHRLQLQARLGSHSSEWAKWIWVAVSNQEVISNWQLLTKGELVFHSAVSLGIFATLKGVLISSSRQPMPNNLNGISGDFFSHIALSTFPLPYWSLLVYYVFQRYDFRGLCILVCMCIFPMFCLFLFFLLPVLW